MRHRICQLTLVLCAFLVGMMPLAITGVVTAAPIISEFLISDLGPGSTRPAGITTGPDGALWFTDTDTNEDAIGRITTSGVFSRFAATNSTLDPSGLTLGPDGALWFTQPGRVGRITTSGDFTYYTVPTFQGTSQLSQGSTILGNYPISISVVGTTPISVGHYLLQIFPVGAGPATAAPLYQASGDLTGGSVVLHQ